MEALGRTQAAGLQGWEDFSQIRRMVITVWSTR